jgi:predicted AlkP superfamily pyrophosphatase or phosphodiesterase
MKNRTVAFALSLLAGFSLVAQTTEGAASRRPASRPVPAIERVILVSIDGGRPDLLLRANCPTIRGLMAQGSYTFWARTTAVAITLPSHVSMLTGVIPVRHGIHWNEDLPLAKPYYPKVPTVFELAKKHGYTTAVVTAKPKFAELFRPGSLDWSYFPGETNAGDVASLTMEKQAVRKKTADNETVVERASEILNKHAPDLTFVHFASNDVAGHGKGWGSADQVAVIEEIDGALGKILASMDSTVREHTAVIVSADHGGAGRSHGADDVRSRTIPWILSGPGIRKNYDLTALTELEVNTYDTFATACYLLAIPVPGRIDGKPIVEAIEERQLLGPTK